LNRQRTQGGFLSRLEQSKLMESTMNENSKWSRGEYTKTGMLIIALVVAFLLRPQTLWAQDETVPPAVDGAVGAEQLPLAGDVSVILQTASEPVAVGDPIELQLDVVHPAQVQAILPVLDKLWGDLEIRSQSPASTVLNQDGTATTSQSIEAVLFAPGNYQTPALMVTLSDGDGNLSQVAAPPQAVTVASLLVEDDRTLRDIKPQAALPIPESWPVALAGGLVALAAVGLAGWWLYRRLARRARFDNRRPEEVANDELERIGALNYPASGLYKEHYSAVTDCLRAYVERQYGVPATDRTTAELKGMLRHTPMATEHIQAFGSLFEEADLVKFAKFAPGPEAAESLIVQAHRLVETTAADLVAARAAAAEAAKSDDSTVTAVTGMA
jgi:hypothetical protein